MMLEGLQCKRNQFLFSTLGTRLGTLSRKSGEGGRQVQENLVREGKYYAVLWKDLLSSQSLGHQPRAEKSETVVSDGLQRGEPVVGAGGARDATFIQPVFKLRVARRWLMNNGFWETLRSS